MRDPDSEARRISYEGQIAGLDDILRREREGQVAIEGSRYLDAKRIASGGMKEIYQIYDTHTERLVAMARMHPEAAMNLKKQFLHEARITASLEHPSIMPVYDIGAGDDSEPYFTMKLIRGRTLGDLITLRHKILPNGQPGTTLEELLGHFLKVCDAMACAHSHGVLHLDIKPENIQVGEFGEVLLCDWGLARRQGEEEEEVRRPGLLPRAPGLTLHGRVFGTPGFMGPEQASDSRQKLAPSADIYSLGAVLYNLLSGQRPYSGSGMTDSMQMTVNGELPPPSSLVTHPLMEVPAALEAVCLRAMALRPENRYASVVELAAEIRAWMSGFATRAEDASLLRQLWLLSLRHKIVVAVIVNAILILAVSTTVFVSNLHRKEKESEANAEQARRNAKEALVNAEIARSKENEAKENLRRWQQTAGEKAKIEEATVSLITEKFSQSNDVLGVKKFFDIASLLPDNPVLRTMQGCAFLANQEFEKAHGVFVTTSIEANKNLAGFALDHRGTRPGELSEEDFLRLCDYFLKPGYENYLGELLNSERKFNQNLSLRIRLFTALMRSCNPHLRESAIDLQALTQGRLADALRLAPDDSRVRLDPLALLGLRNLDLSGCGVSDITILRHQNGLRRLVLSKCPVQRLEPISQLALEELDLSGSAVTDLEPLRKSTIRRLVLKNCRPDSLAPLRDMAKLEELVIGANDKLADRSLIPERVRVTVE